MHNYIHIWSNYGFLRVKGETWGVFHLGLKHGQMGWRGLLARLFLPTNRRITPQMVHGRAMWHFREAGKDGSSMVCKIIEDILGLGICDASGFIFQFQSIHGISSKFFHRWVVSPSPSSMRIIRVSLIVTTWPLPPLNLWVQRRVFSARAAEMRSSIPGWWVCF